MRQGEKPEKRKAETRRSVGRKSSKSDASQRSTTAGEARRPLAAIREAWECTDHCYTRRNQGGEHRGYQMERPDDEHRTVTFLRIAAGLEDRSAADAWR